MGDVTGRVRMVIDLGLSDGQGIEGVVTGTPWQDAQAFSGWLELLRLLEAAVAPVGIGKVVDLATPQAVDVPAADPGS